MSKSKVVVLSIVMTALCLTITESAHASYIPPYGLEKQNPDIFATSLDVKYDSTTNTFTAVGASGNYQPKPGTEPLPGPFGITGTRPYTVSITVDEFGVATAGSLSISGNINTDGVAGNEYSGVLLTGSLYLDGPNFGFQDPYAGPGDAPAGFFDIFEAIFTSTGGAMVNKFGGYGSKIGVIFDANFQTAGLQNFTGSWTGNWDDLNSAGTANTGLGQSDNFLIPAPAALPAGLLLMGIAFVSSWYKRRKS